jgi:hypothetical protein
MKKNLLFLTLLFIFSCKKENEGDGDSQAPMIMMTAPSNAQTFTAGQPIPITANITDNKKIREVHLEIVNTTTGAFITHEHYVPDNAEYLLNRTFTAQPASAYRIKVQAEDFNDNKAKAEINITSN